MGRFILCHIRGKKTRYSDMKTFILFAAVFVLANADSNILRRIKPILMMGETILKMQDKNQCLQKSFCILETMVNNKVRNPLAHLSQFLTNSHLDFETKDFEKNQRDVAELSKIYRNNQFYIVWKTI